MNKKNKISFKKISLYCLLMVVLLGVVYVNYHRLHHNRYPNYEKTIDYGRIKENKIEISPIITALFFEHNNQSSRQDILSYVNRFPYYHKINVKMAIVPAHINEKVASVIENLYAQIFKQNNFRNVNIFYNAEDDINQHKKLLKSVAADNIKLHNMNNMHSDVYVKIEESLTQTQNLTIILNDLTIETLKNDKVSEMIIEIAQHHFYGMKVLDMIDSQIAESMQKDYANLFALAPEETLPELVKQKNNLSQYAKLYGDKILYYFKENFIRSCQNQENLWPPKNKSNYRLYDRGAIYIETKLQNEQKSVIASKKRFGNSIIRSLISMANSLAKHHWDYNIISMRIYLLTENEIISADLRREPLADDEGLYAIYAKRHIMLMPWEYQHNKDNIYQYLSEKLNISADKINQMELYRFKAVEVKNEN